MGRSYLRILREFDFRRLGRDYRMYLPKAWCEDHDLTPGEDDIAVRKEDDGTLSVIPTEILKEEEDLSPPPRAGE